MNGELQELYNQLDKRLAVFESKWESWRNNHDTNSENRANEIKMTVSSIKRDLPCKEHKVDIKWLTWGIRGIAAIIIGRVVFWVMNGK